MMVDCVVQQVDLRICCIFSSRCDLAALHRTFCAWPLAGARWVRLDVAPETTGVSHCYCYCLSPCLSCLSGWTDWL